MSSSRWLAWIVAALSSRRIPALATALSVTLTLPALWNGRQTEDHLQRLLGWTIHLYPRGTGSVLENYARKDLGTMPWIASEDLQIAFFRPLASLSLSADHQLWPAYPWIAHAHSLLWQALLVFSSARLFRKMSSSLWGGGAAALLFAVHDGHGFAAGWLAARHALMAAALSVLALVSYDSWRREQWKPGALIAALLLFSALLSSESALAAIGLFASHWFLLDEAPWRRRAVAALAFVAPVTCWLGLYSIGHYGVRGSGMYVSPLTDPLGAVTEALRRLPWVWVGTLGGSADWGFWLRPDDRDIAAAVASVVVLALGAFLVRQLRGRRVASFWLLALALSAIALTGAPPSDRLLALPVLAGIGVVGEFFATVADQPASASRLSRLASRGLAVVWFVVHGIVSPLLLPSRSRELSGVDRALAQASRGLCTDLRPGQHLVLIQAPDYYFGTLLAWINVTHGCPTRNVRVLYGGVEPVAVYRADPFTVVLSAPAGFLTSPLSRVYRAESRPFAPGDGLSLTDLLITVTQVNRRGEPTEVAFRFAWDLDTPNARIAAWNAGRYDRFVVPPVGETRVLPAILR